MSVIVVRQLPAAGETTSRLSRGVGLTLAALASLALWAGLGRVAIMLIGG